jgi:hypothetical protein
MKIEVRRSESEADIRGRRLTASAEVSCSCRQATGDHGWRTNHIRHMPLHGMETTFNSISPQFKIEKPAMQQGGLLYWKLRRTVEGSK